MDLHVTVKGLNIVLKIMGYYSRERRGLFRSHILIDDILQEGSFADTYPDRRK